MFPLRVRTYAPARARCSHGRVRLSAFIAGRAIDVDNLPLSQVYRLLEPGPVVLLTTARSGRANMMTMSWHMMVEFEPQLIACVVGDRDHSFAALRVTKECVIAIPPAELAEKVVAIGKLLGTRCRQIRVLRADDGESASCGGAADRRLFRQYRMPGRRHAAREPLRPVRAGRSEGVDRSRARKGEDHPS